MSSFDDPRRLVHYGKESISNVSSTDFPGHDPNNDYLWDLKQFKKSLVVKVQRLSNVTVEFDLVGIDTSIANAFRRILIAEVPTMAIENVYLFNNTSVVQDEVLGHRIGLVPLKVDPTHFEFTGPDGGANDRNTLVFDLVVQCRRNPKAKAGETDPDKLYTNSKVHSGDLTWKPQGEQGARFKVPPEPANRNILIAKLRPGQEIEAQFHARKGTGDEHTKWSPVATASYRLLPHIIIHEPIPPHLIPKFKSCFAPGVIESRRNPATGSEEVIVANPRKDTMSREVLRHEEFQDIVQLTRIRDFFLFSIESAGQIPPEQLFPRAVNVLRDKVAAIRSDIEKYVIPSVRMDVDMANES